VGACVPSDDYKNKGAANDLNELTVGAVTASQTR